MASIISNVFVRNGGGSTSCSPSIGCGEKLEDNEDDKPTMHVTTSSSFTNTPSMVIGFPKLVISRNLNTKRQDFENWVSGFETYLQDFPNPIFLVNVFRSNGSGERVIDVFVEEEEVERAAGVEISNFDANSLLGLELDSSRKAAVDGAVKDEAVEDEVSYERTVKCKNGYCPLTICCRVDLQAFDLLSYVAFSHLRAYPYGCRGISLLSRTEEQLVYPLALENN
ncbi:heat shock factor protein HSF30 [Pyrus ussuriensis x Pyrus communis]|uniref:Heat shock factor protein HSF30 n=1 Tax=Pyrus ussuriensis x Pyrus communis TaxID=2448454 RepID=A0A5N5GNI4_9ROSA|nr:heat shock factor protein HSF30 [Pyrus ussuriensis x Pyrus communis]